MQNSLYGQDCEQKPWKIRTGKVKTFIKEYKPLAGLVYADSIINLATKKSRTTCIPVLWFRFERAELLELTSQYDQALLEYYDIIRLADILNQMELLSHCHISVARCFETINRKSDCLRHLKMAKEIIDARGLETVMARYAYRYASYQRIYESRDSAKVYAQKAVILGEKHHIQRAVTDGHLILGIISDDIDTACYHFRMTVKLFAQQGDWHGAASQTQNIASRLMNSGRGKEAMLTLDTAQNFALRIEKNTIPLYQILSGIFAKKSTIFEQSGQLDSAYHYLKLAREYDLHSDYTVNQDAITQQAIDFAIEKEKEKNIYLEKNAWMLRLGIIASIAGLLLFLILFTINRKKSIKIEKQNSIIQEQNQALEESFHKQSILLSEVHHRVKNNLQLVISLLTLHGRNLKEKELNLLLDEVSGKVKSIALIHEQLYSTGEFETINIQEYLEKIMQNFETLQGEKESFSYSVRAQNLFFNLETVMPIGIITSELISNALKYARVENKNLELFIGIEKTEHGFLLQYHDNGPGLPNKSDTQVIPKIGTSLIQSMIRQLQAESKSYNNKGYHFNMIFKEKKVSKL